ncbi:MAG: fold metallo-hydrolase [Thermoleophilia bacterium]|nr:fold metallo-hydrolase [Thermoleophilia bacterium]
MSAREHWRERWLPACVVTVLLVIGILLVELGLRDVATPGVQLPMPGGVEAIARTVRATVFRGIEDPAAAAIASGVVYGRTDHVTATDEAAFLESGLWHLLAASGQNIALVAGCCILLARAAGRGRVFGALVAMAAIPAYVLVVGGGASIVRAGIMGELALLAWLSGRLPDARQLLLVAVTMICWAAPGAHRSLGLQLSAACVAALIFWATQLTRWLTDRGVPTVIAAGTAATVLCSLSTAPVLVLRTGAAPLTGIVANLIAVPLAGGILVAGLAASALQLAGGAVGLAQPGELAMRGVGLLASALLQVAHRAADLPAAQTTSRVLAIGVPIAVLAQHLLRRRRWLRAGRIAIAMGAGCLLLPLLSAASSAVGIHVGGTPPIGPDGVRIAVLDVGQGDATLLVSGQHAVLIDVGPPDGRVVQRVRELGVRRLDGIVLTHDSLDHRGGFEAAHAALRPRWVAKARHAPGSWGLVERLAGGIIDLCAGDTFQVGVASLAVHNPGCDGRVTQRTSDVHNDGAMVLLVEHGGIRALLPADAEAPVLVRLGLPQLAFLRVSHHGSADPDLPELLAATAPSIAAISVGEGNDYGHPTPQALAALRAADVEVTRTDEDGTVVLDSDGSRLVRVDH